MRSWAGYVKYIITVMIACLLRLPGMNLLQAIVKAAIGAFLAMALVVVVEGAAEWISTAGLECRPVEHFVLSLALTLVAGPLIP
jgi:cell division protein FtsW (lipid II flippase)